MPPRLNCRGDGLVPWAVRFVRMSVHFVRPGRPRFGLVKAMCGPGAYCAHGSRDSANGPLMTCCDTVLLGICHFNEPFVSCSRPWSRHFTASACACPPAVGARGRCAQGRALAIQRRAGARAVGCRAATQCQRQQQRVVGPGLGHMQDTPGTGRGAYLQIVRTAAHGTREEDGAQLSDLQTTKEETGS